MNTQGESRRIIVQPTGMTLHERFTQLQNKPKPAAPRVKNLRKITQTTVRQTNLRAAVQTQPLDQRLGKIRNLKNQQPIQNRISRLGANRPISLVRERPSLIRERPSLGRVPGRLPLGQGRLARGRPSLARGRPLLARGRASLGSGRPLLRGSQRLTTGRASFSSAASRLSTLRNRRLQNIRGKIPQGKKSGNKVGKGKPEAFSATQLDQELDSYMKKNTNVAKARLLQKLDAELDEMFQS